MNSPPSLSEHIDTAANHGYPSRRTGDRAFNWVAAEVGTSMALIGCDVGGTYTDMVAFDADAGDLRVGKVPSTPRDQSIGLMDGLKSVDAPPSEISMLLHGTTVATNAVLERAGAPAGC